MYKMKTPIFILLFIHCCLCSFGQETAKRKTHLEPWGAITNDSRVGTPFIKDTVLKTITGKDISFSSLNQNTLVCFGMYWCHPCMQELPVVVALAKGHPEMNFIYVTHNDEKTIKIEYQEVLGKDYQLPGNYSIVIMDRTFMSRNNVNLGYPQLYFLDKDGMVKYCSFGGKVFEKNIFEQHQAILKSMIEKYNN